MPRGSGHPDLSQRPRREAPGMLTGLAILERELGINDYARHILERRLAKGPGEEETNEIRQEIADLESRRQATLQRLEELHEEHSQRQPDAGRAARSRPARRRR